jgi:phage-related protein
MAEPYFIWKGTNSNTMGVVVRSYPPIVCPKERTQDRSVPGRPGSLTMLEGTDVYEPFAQHCNVIRGLPPI